MRKDHLQRMFKHPVPCYGCLDGPGHLIAHLLSGHVFEVTQRMTLYGKMSLKGLYMPVTCIIMGALSGDESFSLAVYFPKVDEYILEKLEEEIHKITGSQFLLLIMTWNTLESVPVVYPVHVASIILGIRNALLCPTGYSST